MVKFSGGIVLLMLIAQACASSHYYFAPASVPKVSLNAEPGEIILIADGKEKSSVRIFPMGIRQVDHVPVFQVRYYFENYEGKIWHLDSKLQKMKYKGAGAVVAGWFPKGTVPADQIDIPSGFSRTVDLHFPVSNSVRSDADLEGLELTWSLKTSTKVIANVSAFTRVLVEDPIVSNSPTKSAKKRN